MRPAEPAPWWDFVVGGKLKIEKQDAPPIFRANAHSNNNFPPGLYFLRVNINLQMEIYENFISSFLPNDSAIL